MGVPGGAQSESVLGVWGGCSPQKVGVAGRQNLPLCQCGVQGMQWEEGEGEGGGESWGRGKGKRGE